jgi:hypothetical protein
MMRLYSAIVLGVDIVWAPPPPPPPPPQIKKTIGVRNDLRNCLLACYCFSTCSVVNRAFTCLFASISASNVYARWREYVDRDPCWAGFLYGTNVSLTNSIWLYACVPLMRPFLSFHLTIQFKNTWTYIMIAFFYRPFVRLIGLLYHHPVPAWFALFRHLRA